MAGRLAVAGRLVIGRVAAQIVVESRHRYPGVQPGVPWDLAVEVEEAVEFGKEAEVGEELDGVVDY